MSWCEPLLAPAFFERLLRVTFRYGKDLLYHGAVFKHSIKTSD